MPTEPSKATYSSTADVTLDAAPPQGTGAADSGDRLEGRQECGCVALIEGTGPELTRETETLLRRRLRLAAILMFFGYVVFLPQHIVRTDFDLPGSGFLFTFHVIAIVVFAVLGGVLFRFCEIPLPRLRMIELAMFGFSAAFLVSLQHFTVLRQCGELAQVLGTADCEQAQVTLAGGMWLLLIFTYALFVPNTWHRAAVVIAVLAGLPVMMVLLMLLKHDAVGQMLSASEVTGFVLMMLVAGVTGLFGVDTIGSLRREAFEARQLGQYRLTRRIGAGGMGEVYLAEHQLMKRPCVVKLIRPDKAGDPRILARFQREVRATAKLSHWNTVEIFDYGSAEDGTFYYVMEYLPGMSLAELVEKHGPLPPARVIHLLRQTCEALSEAHAAGLIHRDIKPGNIFAAQRGGVYDVAKLLDFGLVKPMTDQGSIHLTTEGSITGSPLYMSPEQATADTDPDARSDIYSLGAVGYLLLTGLPPFGGDKPIKVMIAHAHEQPVPPSQRADGIPADLERVVLRCLAKSPSERYQTAAELAAALSACQSANAWTRTHAARWWQEQPQETCSVPGP